MIYSQTRQKKQFYPRIFLASFLPLLILLAGTLLIVSGCGQDAFEFQQAGTGLHYRMKSLTNKLPVGRRATFLVGECTPVYCGDYITLSQAYSAVADANKEVPVDFIVPYAEDDYIYFTVYLDVDDSRNLNSGDWVWGNDPGNFMGYGGYGKVKVLTIFFYVAAVGSWEQDPYTVGWTQYTGGPFPW